MGMLTAIKYNLAHLTDFKGRDARSTFWYYVLFLVLVQFALSLLISVPLTGAMVGDAVGAARDGVAEAEVQARMLGRVAGMIKASMWLSVVLTLATTLLLLAAFTRRLHDSNKPGWIAGLTALIQLAALVLAIASLDDMIAMTSAAQTGDLSALQGMQGKLMLQSLLGWAATIVLIVFGVWPSSPGENRYGPQPVSY
jgi:uncharacterized membrane protein YhaH (DUF805 family)